jgi:hypothetical protein
VSSHRSAEVSHARELRRAARAGVPASLRGAVWPLLCRLRSPAAAAAAAAAASYGSLLAKTSPLRDSIAKDVPRTFPRHQMFRDCASGGQLALHNVLHAFSLALPQVGYCQGMGFVAASLLCVADEERAFEMLCALSQSYSMSGLWSHDLPDFAGLMHAFSEVLRSRLPALHAHFSEHAVEPSMYASQWFITIFNSYLPFDCAARALDLFFADGVKAIFRIALALLATAESTLLKEDLEGAWRVIDKELPPKLDADALTALANSFKVNNSEISTLRAQYKSERPGVSAAPSLQQSSSSSSSSSSSGAAQSV